MELTERQQREIDFHRGYASRHEDFLRKPFSFAVLDRRSATKH